MTNFTHLTDNELIKQLSLRDDLTDLEHELLDRLIRSTDELVVVSDELASYHESEIGKHDGADIV